MHSVHAPPGTRSGSTATTSPEACSPSASTRLAGPFRRTPSSRCRRESWPAATWPNPPPHDAWVFVTENPSVTAAAATLAAGSRAPIRLLCTVGTPSGLEAAAIARLADTGWRIAVRADFDRAGLAHVRAVLDACPAATPRRMSARDYLQALGDRTQPIPLTGTSAVADPRAADTPWDCDLATTMTGTGRPAFEEALLDLLLADLAAGGPRPRPRPL